MPFSNSPWESPESNLSAEDYCKVTLIDLNEGGDEKVKGKCYLPVRSTPNGPYNLAGMASAAAYLMRAKVPPDERRKAARKLARLYREAGKPLPPTLERMAS